MSGNSMLSCQDLPESIIEKIIEVSVEPDLTKLPPAIMVQRHELTKLVTQIETLRKPWLVMKCNDTLYIVWNRLLYCFTDSH
jgi:hypothetical protein